MQEAAQEASEPPAVLRDLGDGLVLRRAASRDIEPLVALFSQVFDEQAGVETRAVMNGIWSIGDLDHFTLVEDTRTRQIVSSLTLFSKTGSYGGIPFGIGQPEFVATHPGYRRRGLVRAQMEVVHAWSEARGDHMQIIGGIRNYYRQFGYEYAVELDIGRVGFLPAVPKLKADETEPYSLRPASETDVPFIAATSAYAQRRYLVSATLGEDYWHSVLKRAQADDLTRPTLHVIETIDGAPVGYLLHPASLRSNHEITSFAYELAPNVPWLPVSFSVLRYLCAAGERYAARDQKPFGSVNFQLGPAHPVYEALHDLLPGQFGPYALYVRVPNLANFLRHLAPVLEQRLAGSILVGYTGECKIGFFRDGLRLVFEQGHLQAAEPWQPVAQWTEDAVFPNLTFLQLLLGHRSLEELEYAYPDCFHRTNTARALLRALFPKQTSYIYPN